MKAYPKGQKLIVVFSDAVLGSCAVGNIVTSLGERKQSGFGLLPHHLPIQQVEAPGVNGWFPVNWLVPFEDPDDVSVPECDTLIVEGV